MVKPLAAIGIAETVFYVPIVPIAIYLLWRNGRTRPRMAWYPFLLFSCMRLAGGPILIALSGDPYSEGLVIAATILLNVGVIPLLIVNFGVVRLVLHDNFGGDQANVRFTKAVRFAIIIAICLLTAGSGLATSYAHASRILTLLGYVVFALILLFLYYRQYKLYRDKHSLLPSSGKILAGALFAAPFIILRNVYGLLYTATNYVSYSADGTPTEHVSVWNPIYGSQPAFGFMALLPEYIAICAFFYVGLTIPPDRGLGELGNRNNASYPADREWIPMDAAEDNGPKA